MDLIGATESNKLDRGEDPKVARCALAGGPAASSTPPALRERVRDPEEGGRSVSAEENKEKARRLMEEAFGGGKLEVIDEVLDPNFVCYDPNSEAGEVRGADTFKQEIEYFRRAVPDLTYTVEDQVAEGDKVVSRWRASGTHQGEFFGVPGSGNRIEMSGIQIDRFDESGKMVEEWPEYDLLGAMRQIGAISE
jgi:steroid delta-isomerase-like uncharacterized protein